MTDRHDNPACQGFRSCEGYYRVAVLPPVRRYAVDLNAWETTAFPARGTAESPFGMAGGLSDEDLTALDVTIDKIGMGYYQWALLALCGFGWLADNMWLEAVTIALPRMVINIHVRGIDMEPWLGNSSDFGKAFAFNATLFFQLFSDFSLASLRLIPSFVYRYSFLGPRSGNFTDNPDGVHVRFQTILLISMSPSLFGSRWAPQEAVIVYKIIRVNGNVLELACTMWTIAVESQVLIECVINAWIEKKFDLFTDRWRRTTLLLGTWMFTPTYTMSMFIPQLVEMRLGTESGRSDQESRFMDVVVFTQEVCLVNYWRIYGSLIFRQASPGLVTFATAILCWLFTENDSGDVVTEVRGTACGNASALNRIWHDCTTHWWPLLSISTSLPVYASGIAFVLGAACASALPYESAVELEAAKELSPEERTVKL
ncbi:uncharacterized protein EI90DRAFT_3022564 [Cantharellus anzutake]|uniref:uncharacterized protein n=1 Tax=Cantharellus anzutake TaxID=1750568 RepID=UPI0019060B56|nr:uncharacterized protein EI90DRAFT_3022564 [Cantharellus anzutake]KAF8313759.1 hypothetical protein EI90DRAFT_3022564 [Cantharellus anzutake]